MTNSAKSSLLYQNPAKSYQCIPEIVISCRIAPNIPTSCQSKSRRVKSSQTFPYLNKSCRAMSNLANPFQIFPSQVEYSKIWPNLGGMFRIRLNRAISLPNLARSPRFLPRIGNVPPQSRQILPGRAKSWYLGPFLSKYCLILGNIASRVKYCILTWSGPAISYQIAIPGQS